MCFSSGSSKPPPPSQPNKFEYGGTQDTVARQAATYESKGYTNTAGYGSELGTGGVAPSAPSPSPAMTTPGGA